MWPVVAVALGAATILVAGALFSVKFEPEFVAFLLSLVAGVAIAIAIVELVLALPAAWSWGVHAMLAVVASGAMIWIVNSDVLGAMTPVALAAGIAACPGVVWLVLALFNRLLALAKIRPHVARNPLWVHEPRRATVEFAAVPMRLTTLAWWIAGIVMIGGVGIAAVVISGGEGWLFAGPKFAIILLAILFGIPAYVLFIVFVRRRQRMYIVVFCADRISVTTGAATRVWRFTELRALDWGGSGEYSRLRLRTHSGERFEIVAGLAKTPRGVGKQLPALSHATVARLASGGLVLRKSSGAAKTHRLQQFVRAQEARKDGHVGDSGPKP